MVRAITRQVLKAWMWTPPPMMHSWGLPMQRCVIALLWGRSPVSARCAFAFRCQGNHCRRPQAHSRQITRDSRSMPRWARAQQTRMPLPSQKIDMGTRRPLSNERLSLDGDGLVVHELKRPFRDGTTHCLFEPLDFLARLAALVLRPRTHLIRYHGVFAPNARILRCWWRKCPCVHPADLMSPRLTPHRPR